MAQIINPIKIVVLLSFVYWAFHYDKRKKHHIYLLAILGLSLSAETSAVLLKLYRLPINLSGSIYNVVHSVLWLAVLGLISGRRKTARILIAVYIVFCALDFCLFEPGLYNFKAYSLISGAFLYTSWLIADSIARLKLEQLSYFSANTYLLLSAPVLFLIGFSLILGFKNKTLNKTEIFGFVAFFDLVCYFVNAVYYGALAVFMYREKKGNYAT